MQLYKLSALLESLLDQVNEDGELPPEWEQVEQDFDRKCENVAMAVRNLEHKAAVQQAQAVEISNAANVHLDNARTLRDKANWLKQYLLGHMRQHDKKKIEGALVSVRVCNNGQPSISLDGDIERLPENLVTTKVTKTLNREAILKRMNETGELPDSINVIYGQHIRLT